MLLHHKLVSTYPELKSSDQLAIISPYREQVERLKQRFRSTYGVEFEKLVESTTVDGCQVGWLILLLVFGWVLLVNILD